MTELKMNPFKFIWSFFFRLFPCPVNTGILKIGNPGPENPVLVTCNFYLTVRRLQKELKGLDLWLLIAESRGINVWCAAEGGDLNTRSVVSALKTSGIEKKVNHRILILPPYSASGVKASEVTKLTGWKVRWGPVYARDIEEYLKAGMKQTEEMKRAKYHMWERLDTAFGSLFLFHFLLIVVACIFFQSVRWEIITSAVGMFLLFFTFCPYLPGRRGLEKAILPGLILLISLVTHKIKLFDIPHLHDTALFEWALVFLLLDATELGGLSSTMRSELDPFLAKLGIGGVGNVRFAATVRTELLTGSRVLNYSEEKCKGCRNCYEVCPVKVWEFDISRKKAVMARKHRCIACRACIVQCNGGAIEAKLI